MQTQSKPSYGYRFNLTNQKDEERIGFCDNKEPPECSVITGNAGSGKTFSVKELVRKNPHSHILAATTGIAAINLGEDACTIHSTLKFFNTDSCRNQYLRGYLQWNLSKLQNQGIEEIHIDESSMLLSPILDDIVEAIADVNNAAITNKRLKLQLVTDFVQLPPVPDKQSQNPRAQKGEFAFKANSWKFFADNIERKTKIWRQDNPEFVSALNALRSANASEAVRLLQNCGVTFADKTNVDFDGTTLMPKNDAVDAFNLERLNKLSGRLLRSLSVRKGKQLKEWDSNIPFEFRTKENALVMILKNDVINWEYVNGDLGHIMEYDSKEDKFRIRLIRNGSIVSISKMTRLNTSDKLPEEGERIGSFKPYPDYNEGKWVIGKIEYHPLRTAWATTIHKSQGLPLDRVQVSTSHSFFGYSSMAYVSISRCRTPQGLVIVGTPKDLMLKIKTSQEVLEWI